MGDYAAVQKLVELLPAFYYEEVPIEENLTYSLTNEFLQNIMDVLFTKEIILHHRWKDVVGFYPNTMPSTPEMLLTYVSYACRQEALVNLNIFERFLSVLALILHLSKEIFDETAVDLSKWIPDIFMAFYDSELKKPFRRRGGFHRFVEYINNPKYLASKCINYLASHLNPDASVDAISDILSQQLNRILLKEKELPTDIGFEEAETDGPSKTLAQKILNTIIELPQLPNEADTRAKLVEDPQQTTAQFKEGSRSLDESAKVMALRIALEQFSRLNSDSGTNDVVGQLKDNTRRENTLQDETVEEAEEKNKIEIAEDNDFLEKTWKDCCSSNSDSTTNHTGKEAEDFARYENIVQAVIAHNRSKRSDLVNQNNPCQKTADEILESLVDKIRSLIEVLDGYGKE